MNISDQPFSCTYNKDVATFLFSHSISIGVSTYQAGKIILLSGTNSGSIIQMPRNFKKPMGIAIHKHKKKIAIATMQQVLELKNVPELNNGYKKNEVTPYDAMFVPRAQYITGPADIHDLSYLNNDLYAVNTLFSCIVKINSDYSFEPVWIPSFIDRLVPEDRCHLNGMASDKEHICYVSAFNNGNSKQSWRDAITQSGILIDYQSKEICLDNLAMPHSPRIHNGELYFLQSGKGTLCKADVKANRFYEIYKTDAFLRGMSFYKHYAFIGLSKLRENSKTFSHLNKDGFGKDCGVLIVDIERGIEIGRILYTQSVEEIFDVCILEHSNRPNILNLEREESYRAMETPFGSWWAVVKE